MTMVKTIDELKPVLMEMWEYYWNQSHKLYSLPEKQQKKQMYEIGFSNGANEAVSAIMLAIGMPMFDIWLKQIEKDKEEPDLPWQG